MIRFIESNRIEFFILAVFAISIGLSIARVSWATSSLNISFLVLVPLYIIRMIVSFRHWKLSRGIAVINAMLNFQIANALLAIGYTFLKLPGANTLIPNAILGAELYIPIIAIFLLARWRKINRKLYWEFSKWNFVRMLVSTTICIIILYSSNITPTVNT